MSDKQQQDLIIKQAIDKIDNLLQDLGEKPKIKTLETNAMFSYLECSSEPKINIRTINDVQELIKIYAYLNNKEKYYNQNLMTFYCSLSLANTELLKYEDYPFTWLGYSLDAWKSDIRGLIEKILYYKKEKELKGYKSKLEDLLSPDMKDKLQLDSILAALDKF